MLSLMNNADDFFRRSNTSKHRVELAIGAIDMETMISSCSVLDDELSDQEVDDVIHSLIQR